MKRISKLVSVGLFCLSSSCAHMNPKTDLIPCVRASAPIVFYNISDAHVIVPNDRNGWRLSKDGLAILKETVRAVNQGKPRFAFLSGDVMEGKFYGMKNLSAAIEALSDLKMPWFVVAGNHDGRYVKKDNTLDEFNQQEFFKRFQGHGPSLQRGYWKTDIPASNVTLVGLNSSIEGSSYGEIDEDQRKWLGETLAEIPDDRLVIMIAHHPLALFNPVILDPDKKALDHFVLKNHEQVRAMIEKHKHKVKVVITGHTHSTEYKEENGIHYIGSPSINTWPNRFTRFELRGNALQWEHIPIGDKALIQEAWVNLATDSPFKTALKTDGALKDYFLHGPLKGEVQLDCSL